jgi:hypothetical protein
MKIKEKNLSFTKLNQTHLNHKENKKARFIKTKFTIHYPIKTSKTHILKHTEKKEKQQIQSLKREEKVREGKQGGIHRESNQ